MINIVTALYFEAKSIISKFNLKYNNNLYQNNDINLIVTGQGKIKSAINTSLLLSRYPYPTINIGIAGSNKFNISEGFFIHKIIDIDSGLDYYLDYFDKSSEEIFCVSRVKDYYSLVDMESSGFFEACYKFLNVEEFALYKIVSDTPLKKSDDFSDLISKHIYILEKFIEEKNIINEDFDFSFIENFNLTFSQKIKLRNLLKLAYLKNIKIEIEDFKNKYEASKFIENLENKLK